MLENDKKMTNFLVKNEKKKMKKMSQKMPKNTMNAKLKINQYPNITSMRHLHASLEGKHVKIYN